MVGVRSNDTDVEGDAFSRHRATTPGHGSVSSSTTSCTYTPTSGTTDPTRSRYTVCDGHGGTATDVSVAMTVSSNAPPIGVDDLASTRGRHAEAITCWATTPTGRRPLSAIRHSSPVDGSAYVCYQRPAPTRRRELDGTDSFQLLARRTAGELGTDTVRSPSRSPGERLPVAVDDSTDARQGFPYRSRCWPTTRRRTRRADRHLAHSTPGARFRVLHQAVRAVHAAAGYTDRTVHLHDQDGHGGMDEGRLPGHGLRAPVTRPGASTTRIGTPEDTPGVLGGWRTTPTQTAMPSGGRPAAHAVARVTCTPRPRCTYNTRRWPTSTATTLGPVPRIGRPPGGRLQPGGQGIAVRPSPR